MTYIENPKTKGSGIITCIPQTGNCPNNCPDCFFQSGRSYLEPLNDTLPNMPSKDMCKNMIVRVNDGNDSNVNRKLVINSTKQYPMKFYNTAIPTHLDKFDAPVVLTVNPGIYTDTNANCIKPIPKNLMFVRFRTNTWNLDICDTVVEYYTSKEIPVVLTFMAYFLSPIPDKFKKDYIIRKRTLNTYMAIKTSTWRKVMKRYEDNYWVYSCGKIEGEKGKTGCRWCGNCIREYFATIERMK